MFGLPNIPEKAFQMFVHFSTNAKMAISGGGGREKRIKKKMIQREILCTHRFTQIYVCYLRSVLLLLSRVETN